MQTQTFDTKPLLRPDQLQSAQEEIKALEHKLSNPLIQDKGEVNKQLRRARHTLETQTPRAPQNPEEEGRMVARSKELLGQILEGMPSQEEMRKAPPGAVDKHRQWERRNKSKILEWKNLQLRLTVGSGDREVANLERHRPKASTLNMDSAQIPGRNFFMPDTAGPSVVFTSEQIALLRTMSPQLADALAIMTNPQRQEVKDAVVGIGLAPSKPGKRQMSKEQKEKMRAGREAAAKRKAEQPKE
jgi:hypothetical protein